MGALQRHDALAAMLTAGADQVLVIGDGGAPAGLLRRDTIGANAAAGTASPP